LIKDFPNFGNVYFLNEASRLYFLEQFSGEKFNEIEITTSEDFIESFEEWAQNRSLNELFLIWLVLKELENDTLKLENLVDEQCRKFNIPSWLALSGTLAFYSVHYLNKILIEEEIKNRQVEFDAYTTPLEAVIVANNQVFKIERNLLTDLKMGIYHDQLDKSFFQELADTITEMTLQ
jgi:hypothetical protein